MRYLHRHCQLPFSPTLPFMPDLSKKTIIPDNILLKIALYPIRKILHNTPVHGSPVNDVCVAAEF